MSETTEIIKRLDRIIELNEKVLECLNTMFAVNNTILNESPGDNIRKEILDKIIDGRLIRSEHGDTVIE
jgi:hypothetical protein